MHHGRMNFAVYNFLIHMELFIRHTAVVGGFFHKVEGCSN